jgi:hypothetical protein
MANDVMLSQNGLEAAADSLYATGIHHHWWQPVPASWRDLDPIARDEFLDVVAATVAAYISKKM